MEKESNEELAFLDLYWYVGSQSILINTYTTYFTTK